MDESKLKRKSEHEPPHLYSKENKVLPGYMETQTEFNDMYDDVIEMILHCLQLEDLANVSDTSKRLRNIAGSVFSQKYRNHLISIDIFDHVKNRVLLNGLHIRCKNEPIVRITDAKIWFKLLRNFGESIKYIRIQSDPIKHFGPAKNVIEYVLEYCRTDSLEVLGLEYYPFLPLNKPLTSLTEFFGYHYRVVFEAVELMPNIRTLGLSRVPKAINNCFPHLTKVSLLLRNSEDAQLFINFTCKNRQIKKLKLTIEFDNFDRNEIYSSIVERLPELKSLRISLDFSKIDTTRLISTYRFKTIETFSISGFGNTMYDEIGSFEFTDLKKLTFSPTVTDVDWTNVILRNKKLKIIKTYFNRRIDYDLLIRELPELEKLIILCRTEEQSLFWTEGLTDLNYKWSRVYSTWREYIKICVHLPQRSN